MQVLSTLVLCFVQQCYIVPFAIFFVMLPRLFNTKFMESNIKVIQIRGFN